MKAIALSVLLLLCASAFGQFKPRAAFDYFPGTYHVRFVQSLPASTGLDEWATTKNYGSFRVRMGADYTYKRLTAYFDQYVYMDKSEGISFQPLQAEWYAGMKFRISDGLHLRFEHLCIHPILSSGSYITQIRMYGGYNMVSISYGY
ncbi:hypothetical protein JZU61_04325 [bacterium]|jgi:hypothetical protein|nr:hypothetical protein [bacterium]